MRFLIPLSPRPEESIEGRRRSKRLQDDGGAMVKMQVVTTKSQPTYERRLFGRSCEWKREQMNMLRCRFHQMGCSLE